MVPADVEVVDVDVTEAAHHLHLILDYIRREKIRNYRKSIAKLKLG